MQHFLQKMLHLEIERAPIFKARIAGNISAIGKICNTEDGL